MQLFQWFGAFLTQIAENCGGIGPAVCVFTLIAAVFLFPSTMGEIRSLQLADKIRDLHNGIIQKYGSDSGKMARELIGMHKTFGYHTFLGLLSYLVHGFLIFLLTAVFSQPDRFLSVFGEGSRSFLWIGDLSSSPLDLIRSGSWIPAFPAALLSLAAADILITWSMRIILRKSLMPMQAAGKIITAALLLVCFFTPQAVTVYVILFFACKDLQYFIILRFFPYRFNRQQEQYYRQCLRNIKRV